MIHADAVQLGVWSACIAFFGVSSAIKSVSADDEPRTMVADLVARIGNTIALGFSVYAFVHWGLGI